MGPEVKEFETNLMNFTGSKFALTCANGTDALSLVLMAWNIGKDHKDAVFVPSFTYVASAEAPAQLGATPFFVDVKDKTFNIDPNSFKQAIFDAKSINLKPKAVIAVDLFGQPAEIDEIHEIAKNENIKVLVDSAQSFGGLYKNKRVGNFGDATTTSFFPAKPLGCYGDGGAVFTNDKHTADVINSLRLHGKGEQKYDNIRIGLNSRLDTIQAAILDEKLKIFENELIARREVASYYTEKLKGEIQTPSLLDECDSAWAQYTIQIENRDYVKGELSKSGIPSVIYYPIPLSEQQGYKHYPQVTSGTMISSMLSKKVLSLPMHPYLDRDKQNYIIDSLLNIV
jgi:dTDP-4-amino-4,6-dideoxygalactose transaminase